MTEPLCYIKHNFLIWRDRIQRIPGHRAIPSRIVRVDSGIPIDIIEPGNSQPFLVTISQNTREYTIFDSLTYEKALEKCYAYCRSQKDTAFVAKRDGIYSFQASGRRCNESKFMEASKATFLAYNQQTNYLAVQQGSDVQILSLPVDSAKPLYTHALFRTCELFAENSIEPIADQNMWNSYGQVWYTMYPLRLEHPSCVVEIDGQIERYMFGSVSRILYFCYGTKLYFFDTYKRLASYLVLDQVPIAVRALRSSVIVFYHGRVEEYDFPVFVASKQLSIADLTVFSAGLHCELGNARVFLDAVSERFYYGCNDVLLDKIRQTQACAINDGILCGMSSFAPFYEISFSEVFNQTKEQRLPPEGNVVWREHLDAHYADLLSLFSGQTFKAPLENQPVNIQVSWAHVDFNTVLDVARMNVRLALPVVDNLAASCNVSQYQLSQRPSRAQEQVSQRASISQLRSSQISQRASNTAYGPPLPTLYPESAALMNSDLGSRRTSATQMDLERLTLVEEKHDKLSEVYDLVATHDVQGMALWLARNDECYRDQVVQAYNDVCIDSIDKDIIGNFAQREAELFNLLFQPHYRAWVQLIRQHLNDEAIGYLILSASAKDIPPLNDFCYRMYNMYLIDLLRGSSYYNAEMLCQHVSHILDGNRSSIASTASTIRSSCTAGAEEGDLAQFQHLIATSWQQAVAFACRNIKRVPGLFDCLTVIFDPRLREAKGWDVNCVDARDQALLAALWNNEEFCYDQNELARSAVYLAAKEINI